MTWSNTFLKVSRSDILEAHLRILAPHLHFGSLSMLRIVPFTLVITFIALGVMLITPASGNPGRPATAVYHVPCQTEYCAGIEPEDLQVHVTGIRYDTLELYFRNEVARVPIRGATNLHMNQSVLLARKNILGTFAIRFGQSSDRVIAYAWFTDEAKPVPTAELQPFPGEPLTLRWMTDRILKIVPSCDQNRSLIIRFTNQGNKRWERYDGPTDEWLPL